MTVTIVVPCFDEAARFDAGAFQDLVSAVDRLVVVDDGSADATPDLLAQLAGDAPDRVEVVRLPSNRGKAEAVRVGMAAAIAGEATVVGYFDADFATPVSELRRLVQTIDDSPQLQAVLASRVALLGYAIDRKPTRHYLGRMYATAASLVLGVPVYDTQCGAKLFRVNSALRAAIATPFPDRWSFDVELLARLLYPADGVEPVAASEIVEVPLREWHDVGGSKLHTASAMRSVVALTGVRRGVRARRGPR